MSDKERDRETASRERKIFSRRSLLTHFAAGVSGWILGGVLNPFRRKLNEAIAETRFGRQAKVFFGYGPLPDNEYRLWVVNNGREAAENVAAYIAFEKKISSAKFIEIGGSPPIPGASIDVNEDGVAEFSIDFLRREWRENTNPVVIVVDVEEGTKSPHAEKIQNNPDSDMFLSYRYSWTFLGERYYESTTDHIIES